MKVDKTWNSADFTDIFSVINPFNDSFELFFTMKNGTAATLTGTGDYTYGSTLAKFQYMQTPYRLGAEHKKAMNAFFQMARARVIEHPENTFYQHIATFFSNMHRPMLTHFPKDFTIKLTVGKTTTIPRYLPSDIVIEGNMLVKERAHEALFVGTITLDWGRFINRDNLYLDPNREPSRLKHKYFPCYQKFKNVVCLYKDWKPFKFWTDIAPKFLGGDTDKAPDRYCYLQHPWVNTLCNPFRLSGVFDKVEDELGFVWDLEAHVNETVPDTTFGRFNPAPEHYYPAYGKYTNGELSYSLLERKSYKSK